jgi:aerobic-type carbon monoxide dehydrogenase small subunit (CoxS/CutS family)
VINIFLNGESIQVREGTTVAAELLNRGIGAFRTSVGGNSRQPVCGMGVCFECRVTIDGAAHQRSCLIPVCEGMNIVTG